MKNKIISAIPILFGVCLIAACGGPSYDPEGFITEPPKDPLPRIYSDADVDAVVTSAAVTIAAYRDLAEYGVDANEIPERFDCNVVTFIRYRLNNEILNVDTDPATANYADIGVLIAPGVIQGANGFEYIARHLVYNAYVNKGVQTEIWAMERRNNCIEDRVAADVGEELYEQYQLSGSDGGIVVTQAEHDTLIDNMVGYYYGDDVIDGRSFDGWYESKDVPYLAEFGLRMDTEDMFQIIIAMVPDQQDRKEKVIVGGHSLGGFHTGVFASWDLDGDPDTLDDAGYNNAAGFFALDSVVTPMDKLVDLVVQGVIPIIGETIIGFGENLTWPIYEIALAGLRSGILPRIVEGGLANATVGSPIGPEALCLIEAVGFFAYAFPEKEHVAMDLVYDDMSDGTKSLMQKLVSRDRDMLEAGIPRVTDFRFTNEALLGMIFDDGFSHMFLINASVGAMYSDDPEGGLAPKPDIGDGLFAPSNAGEMECDGPWSAENCRMISSGPLYKWANFDEVAREGDDFMDIFGDITFTTYKDEGSDIRGLARSSFVGDSNMTEWYFSVRRYIDLMAVTADYAPNYGLNTIHQDEALVDKPVLEILSENGIIVGPGAEDNLAIDPIIIEGFNHTDVAWAAANVDYRDDADVVGMLVDWMVETVPSN